ncbi:hypothetical protein ABW20_dc0107123 [Dactylellina cionopaga]|nr:hypothetical protein ABW20_dc0107123 [Dactylellina cionopaga]
MTVAGCLQKAAGYRYAAVEYFGECYYGNVLAVASAQTANTNCNSRCDGKKTEICGGADAIALYESSSYTPPPALTSVGCFTDSSESRALQFYYVDWNHMTIEKCKELSAGYRYAALEYYGECFWGNSINPDTNSQPSNGCNTPCTGNNAQMCGGSGQMSLYENSNYQPPQPPTLNQGNDMFTLSGCFSGTGQILANVWDSDSMTVDKCLEKAESYLYAAVRGGTSCLYGDELTGATQGAIGECMVACSGKSNEICGGQGKSVIYASPEFTLFSLEEMLALLDGLTLCQEEVAQKWAAFDAQVALAEQEANEPGLKKRWPLRAARAAILRAIWENTRQCRQGGQDSDRAVGKKRQRRCSTFRSTSTIERWALNEIRNWIQDVLDRNHDPPNNPEDPEEPEEPEDPDTPITPCACGADGCPLPPDTPFKLEKRGKLVKRNAYQLGWCPALSYNTNTYPSSGDLIAYLQGQFITLNFLDLNYFTVAGTHFCIWQLQGSVARRYTSPASGVHADYATVNNPNTETRYH